MPHLFFLLHMQILYFIAELICGIVVNHTPIVNPANNPTLGPSGQVLLIMGAKNAYLILAKYQVFRYIVPIIMHAGFIHIILNLYLQIRMVRENIVCACARDPPF